LTEARGFERAAFLHDDPKVAATRTGGFNETVG